MKKKYKKKYMVVNQYIHKNKTNSFHFFFSSVLLFSINITILLNVSKTRPIKIMSGSVGLFLNKVQFSMNVIDINLTVFK